MKKRNIVIQDRSTLQERVTAAIREGILRREFAPGERLVQEELAEMLGVSRMPIRETLRQLESEGLVELVPHKGAIVTPISLDDIQEIYELRALIEGFAVERSLPHLTDQDKADLEFLTREMEKAAEEQDTDRFSELNEQFHNLLRQGCRGKRIHSFIQNLWNGYTPHSPHILQDQVKHSVADHCEMLEAVNKNDAKLLRRKMEQHILRTGEALIAYLVEHGEKKKTK